MRKGEKNRGREGGETILGVSVGGGGSHEENARRIGVRDGRRPRKGWCTRVKGVPKSRAKGCALWIHVVPRFRW